MDDIALLKEQVAKHPGSILFVKLAEACHGKGMMKDAIMALRQGLDRKPTFNTARALLGRYYIEAEMYSDAIKELRRVLVASPEDVHSLMLLADACRMGGMQKEALVYYRKALELDPLEKRADIYIRQLTGRIAPEEAALEELALPPEAEVTVEEAMEEKTMVMKAPVFRQEPPQAAPVSKQPAKPLPPGTPAKPAAPAKPPKPSEPIVPFETEDRTIIMHAPVFEEEAPAAEAYEEEERTMIMPAPSFEEEAPAAEAYEEEERTIIMQAPAFEQAPAPEYDENPEGDLLIGEIDLEPESGALEAAPFGEEAAPGDMDFEDRAGAADDYEVGEISLEEEPAGFGQEAPFGEAVELEQYVPHMAEATSPLSDEHEVEPLETEALVPEGGEAFAEDMPLEETGMFEQFVPHEAEAITTLTDAHEAEHLQTEVLAPEAPPAFPDVVSLEDTGMFEKFAPHEEEEITPLADERESLHIQTEDLAEEALEEAAFGEAHEAAAFSLDDTGMLASLAREARSAVPETEEIPEEIPEEVPEVFEEEERIIEPLPEPVARAEDMFRIEPQAMEALEPGEDEAAFEMEPAGTAGEEFSFADVTVAMPAVAGAPAAEMALAEAEILVASGDYPAAMDVYKRVLAKDPDNGAVLQKMHELIHLIKVQGLDTDYQARKLEKFLGAIHRRKDEFFGSA